MKALKPGQREQQLFWVLVLMTAWKSCQYCFGFSQGMEILSRGNTKSVRVPMKAWKFCNQNKRRFGLQWRLGIPVNREPILLSSNEGMEILSRNKNSFGFNEGMEILSTGKNNCLGFNDGMEILSILFRFQSRHGNPVKRKHKICLSSNEGMEILSPGNKHCLGCNEGLKIMPTANKYFLSSNEGMEVLSRGTRLFGFQWMHGNRVNRKKQLFWF